MPKRIFYVLFCAMLFAGCDAGYGPDETHPVYRKALRCRSTGKYAESEALLKRFLKSRPKSARGCLALAQLYDENLNDPLSAVYYYREFLKIDPDSTESRDVRRLMQRCEERMQSAKNRQQQTRKLEAENIRLKKTLIQYGKNMEKMRVELNESEKRAADAENKAKEAAAAASRKAEAPHPMPVKEIPAAEKQEAAPEIPPEVAAYAESAPAEELPEMEPEPASVPEKPQGHPDSLSFVFPAAGLSDVRPRRVVVEPMPPATKASASVPEQTAAATAEWPKHYVVKPGDSLSAISRRFYGTTRYYTKIMEVNQITNTRGLSAGQTLLLPAPGKEVRK